MEDDEDVILEGSELHNHLVNNGYQDVETRSPTKHAKDFSKELTDISEESKKVEASRATSSVGEGRRLLTSAVWSDSVNKLLEVELAQEILKSELLVTEDEDFINNFILSEDVLENYKLEKEGGSRSYLGEVLMISGSLAAVAGAVFFLSERTRAAAAAAAILPTVLAAASSARVGAKVQSNAEAEQFKELLKYMIQNMKTFKQLLRKSLNLIQGMEMMNQGYLMASGYGNNQPYEAASQSDEVSQDCDDEHKLSKALCKRSSFIALRRAIYSCTLQMILVYRESVEFLMEVTPLAEHIDLKDHYLAFIDLDTFGLESDPPDSRLSVRQLKDTIQLNLLQQSEYLRRFSLAFCDKVREDESLNKSGILKHVKDTVTKIRKVTEKLAKVFEYHQALGLLPVPELEQRALTLRKQQSIDMVKKLLPLRNVYTSLFSTGLHLQNSLLKVRHLESFFDVLDKYKASQEQGGAGSSNQLPTEEKLLEWLKGFKDIQGELNACLTCLEDGVGQIDDLKRPPSSRSNCSDVTSPDVSSSIESVAGSSSHNSHRVITESDEQSNVDEVYEAFIDCDQHKKDEDRYGEGVADEAGDQVLRKQHKQQSQNVLKELKSVLVVKEQEFQLREAKAIARQARVNSIDGASPVPSTSSTLSAASGSSSAVPGCSSAVQGSSLADPKSSTAIPSCSTTVSGSSQAIPSCSKAVPESSSAIRGGPSANLGASTAVQGSSLPVTAVPESSSSDPISLTAVHGSWLADQSLNKAVPSSSSIVLGRSAVPGSLSAASSSPRAVKRSSPSATNGITVVANGTPSKNCLNLPINGNNSEKLDSISGTNPSNGDKETHISLIKQNSTEEDKSPAKPKQEKEIKAKLNSIAAAAHQPPAKATSLDSHLPSAKPNSQLLLQRLKSLESPVPLNLKIEALSSDIGLDQLSASSDFLPDSFYMRSSIEREINYQATSVDLYEPTTTTSPDQSTKDDMSIHQGCDDEHAVNKCSDDTVVKMDNDSNGINSSQHDNDHKVATTANSDIIEIDDNKTNGHNESNINGHDTHTEENDVKDDDIHQQDLNGHFIDDETDASDIIFQDKTDPFQSNPTEDNPAASAAAADFADFSKMLPSAQLQDNSSINSRLEVPVPSLVKSNVLSASQETDSECDTFRSDTNTIKSQDTDPGHHSDSVSILHSSRTQDTYESTPDSSDCDDLLEKKIENFKRNKLRSLPQMSNSVQPSSGASCEQVKCIENRSFSTPDLKRISGCDTISSPYVSLEKLPEKRRVPRGPPYHQAADSSTDSTSSDEEAAKSAATGSGGQSFSRPRRPGAGSRHRRPQNRRKSGVEPSGMKSIQEDNHSQPPQASINNEIRLGTEPSIESRGDRIGEGISATPANHTSVYLTKHRGEDLSYNTQPVGFTASLAAEAAARSRLLRQGFTSAVSQKWPFGGGKNATGGKSQTPPKEETFGASDSD